MCIRDRCEVAGRAYCRHLPQKRKRRNEDSDDGAGAHYERDDLPDAAATDDEEHAGGGTDRPVRPTAEDASVYLAGRLRRWWRGFPVGCAHLLDHIEPVDDGPAVLCDSQ